MNPDRAREIAEALGFEYQEIGVNTGVFGWGKDGALISVGLPDFSLPEWQIKIQEAVRELWCDGDTRWIECEIYSSGIADYWVMLQVKPDTGTRGRAFTADTFVEAWTDALLWLAKQKAGKR